MERSWNGEDEDEEEDETEADESLCWLLMI